MSVEKGVQGHGKSKGKNGRRKEDTSPEKNVLDHRARGLLRDEGLASSPGEKHLDGVAAVQQTGDFDQSCGLHGEVGKPVVDVVKHASRGVDLGRDFTNHGSHEEDGQSGIQKDLVDGNGHSKNQHGVVIGMGAQVFDENKSQNHELTTHQITIEGLATVDDGHDLVCSGVGFLVEMHVDGRETDKRCLPSFDHGEPIERNPEDEESAP